MWYRRGYAGGMRVCMASAARHFVPGSAASPPSPAASGKSLFRGVSTMTRRLWWDW